MGINQAKKVLIFSTAYLPLIGGAEIAVKEITERIPASQFDLICAKIRPGLQKREQLGNVNVYRLGWGCFLDKYFLPLFGFFKAKTLSRAYQYNLIWSIMASFGGLTALFFKLRNSKIPFLLTLQEGDSPEHIQRRARWLGPLFTKIFKQADYIQAISHYLANWAKEMGAKCKIQIVPNGVDIEKFGIRSGHSERSEESQDNSTGSFGRLRQPQDDKEGFIAKLGLKPNDKVIITVSRLVEKNGIEDLIEAVDKLSIKLLIIGSGPLEKKLKEQVTRRNLQEKVLFLGSVPYDELPKYYSLADVFVRPSLSEGLGSAFLEAMAAGVPIIGTAIGGIPDFLKDGETGLFCQPKNPQSIAEKIKLLLTDEDLRKKLITNGRKLIEEEYTWNIIASKMEKIFNHL